MAGSIVNMCSYYLSTFLCVKEMASSQLILWS